RPAGQDHVYASVRSGLSRHRVIGINAQPNFPPSRIAAVIRADQKQRQRLQAIGLRPKAKLLREPRGSGRTHVPGGAPPSIVKDGCCGCNNYRGSWNIDAPELANERVITGTACREGRWLNKANDSHVAIAAGTSAQDASECVERIFLGAS